MKIDILGSLATIPWWVWVSIFGFLVLRALNERRNRKWLEELEARRKDYEERGKREADEMEWAYLNGKLDEYFAERKAQGEKVLHQLKKAQDKGLL